MAFVFVIILYLFIAHQHAATEKPKRMKNDPEPNAIAGAIKQSFAKPAQSIQALFKSLVLTKTQLIYFIRART
ncbi:hypothetical protein [Polaromonas vacuolata]|uniref:hypothetical protein n=1 Tax=Polaromonas vacuolata TaxID=37448 RepID=UPI0014567E50|nr:hypothetical protein [Polaromonas vacuolata]